MRRSALVLSVFSLAMAACQRQLMPTPNLHIQRQDNTFDRVPVEFQSNQVDVLYITDRQPSEQADNGPAYGYDRSPSLAFGSCTVQIGGISWDELVLASRTERRAASLPLSILQVRETARFPPVPYPIISGERRPIEDPLVLAAHDATEARLHDVLAFRLSRTQRKHAFVYVHGFNNKFEDAVFVSAELWHFLGRQGVPICYTWPAGRAWSQKGYAHDRESGEFTVFHFKQVLRALGRCEQIEKVHILAHSRGTAVVTTALRELNIEHTYAPISARQALKLGNVVLAAADLDFEVVLQRLAGEHFEYLPERLTIYTSPADRALAFAANLTLGISRLGQIDALELTKPRIREMHEHIPITFVTARVHSGLIGHSYFTDSPAVASDLILVLRDDLPPGAEHGRPLTDQGANFWELRDDYLRPR